MKKLLPILLALLLLAGCAAHPIETIPSLSLLPSKPSIPMPTIPLPPVKPELPACEHSQDQYENIDKTAFYTDYTPACCWEDAQLRSEQGLLSGLLEVPAQMFTRSSYQPMSDGMYVHNSDSYYADNGNTYIVLDGYGEEVLRIYRGGGYITLEEVAAYMLAFGGSADAIPANYTANKKGDPKSSIWGEHLRLNHSNFNYNPSKYPYEPALPNILGSIGGTLQYYEMDIGTAGYNDGSRISRGAARLVYAREDMNGNGIFEENEVYIFFTHNHYHDFTEYLNYYGGWGLTFGDETGGGTSNPTPYPEVVYDRLSQWQAAA